MESCVANGSYLFCNACGERPLPIFSRGGNGHRALIGLEKFAARQLPFEFVAYKPPLVSNLDDGVAVAGHHGIMRHQPHWFHKRLCNEDPVERVLVVRGQFPNSDRMLDLERQETVTDQARA